MGPAMGYLEWGHGLIKGLYLLVSIVLKLSYWGRDKMAAMFQTTFSNGFSWKKMFEFWLKFHRSLFPRVQLTNIPALVQIMAWRRPGDKPLYEPMLVKLPTHICVTRPQWVIKWDHVIPDSDISRNHSITFICHWPFISTRNNEANGYGYTNHTMIFSSLTSLGIVIMATSGAHSNENFINMMTLSVQ